MILPRSEAHVWIRCSPGVQKRSSYFVQKVLSCYLGKSPRKIFIKRDRRGKPFLGPVEYGERIHFSLSHSEDVLAIVVSRGPVGIDIEFIDKKLDFNKILNRFFPKYGVSKVSGKTAIQRRRSFFQVWTSQEALAKLKGTGLIQELCSKQKNMSHQVERVTFFTPAQNFMGAIATQNKVRKIITHAL